LIDNFITGIDHVGAWMQYAKVVYSSIMGTIVFAFDLMNAA
jgi:hypothetical protein